MAKRDFICVTACTFAGRHFMVGDPLAVADDAMAIPEHFERVKPQKASKPDKASDPEKEDLAQQLGAIRAEIDGFRLVLADTMRELSAIPGFPGDLRVDQAAAWARQDAAGNAAVIAAVRDALALADDLPQGITIADAVLLLVEQHKAPAPGGDGTTGQDG